MNTDTIDRIDTSDAFADWLSIAMPGESCVYHTGCLAVDRLKDAAIHKTAFAALRAAGYRYIKPSAHDRAGTYEYVGSPKVALVQKRRLKAFDYLAVRL